MPVNFLPPPHRIDWQLCCAMLLLLFFGVATLYSLATISAPSFTPKHFYWHCIYILGAVGLFVAALRVPLDFWRRNMALIMFLVLILCFVTVTYAPTKGASRWIRIFGLSLQVSELLKFVTLIGLASWGALVVENNALRSKKLSHVLRPMIPLGMFLFGALTAMFFQKDFGTFFLLALLTVLALVVAGMPWRFILLAGACVFVIASWLVWSEPYRVQRVTAFLDPFADPFGRGYAQLQSLMAYANGGWFGVGAGGSLQKELLPEVHNDFIIAVIAEEHGLLGFFTVCSVYMFIAMRVIKIGDVANARGELFGAFYAYILSALLLLQVTINIGGSLAVLPSKGITLPLISYGGSSLWATMFMLGVLQRLHGENNTDRGEER